MIQILNAIIAGVGAVLQGLIWLLPTSPFTSITLDATWLKYINFFLPVSSMLAHVGLYVTAAAAYYLIRVALRWAKAIE